MNASVKKEWIRALRSGQYKQTHAGVLKVLLEDGTPKYCCLGILCEISPEVRESATPRHGRTGNLHVEFMDEEGYSATEYLPVGFRKRIGLTAEVQNILAAKNDNGESFEMIADYIEKNVPSEGDA